MGVENKKMENKRNEEKKWEKIRIEKEIRKDLARLRTISSLFASDFIGEVELRVMIQEINELSLVAVTVDLLSQYQKKIAMVCEDYPEEISQKALIEATKELDKLSLIRLIIETFKNKKEKYWKEENKKQKQRIKNNTTIEAEINVSSFFCLKF